MIKIVKGVYGMRDKKIIRPVKAGDPPIELDSAEEERLVKLGIAAYVNTPAKEEPSAPAATEKAGKKSKAKQPEVVPAEEPKASVDETADETPGEEEAPDLSATDTVVDE